MRFKIMTERNGVKRPYPIKDFLSKEKAEKTLRKLNIKGGYIKKIPTEIPVEIEKPLKPLKRKKKKS